MLLAACNWLDRVGDELNLSIGVIEEECGSGRHKPVRLK